MFFAPYVIFPGFGLRLNYKPKLVKERVTKT